MSYLYALQWTAGKLYQVANVGGDAGFSFGRRRSDGALIVIRRSGRSVGIPTELAEFYAWNGLQFYDAGKEFASYYRPLAASCLQTIESDRSETASSISDACAVALDAFYRMGSPAEGLRACREARDRLLAGRAISGLPNGTAKQLAAQRRFAVVEIGRIVEDFYQAHPSLSPAGRAVPRSR